VPDHPPQGPEQVTLWRARNGELVYVNPTFARAHDYEPVDYIRRSLAVDLAEALEAAHGARFSSSWQEQDRANHMAMSALSKAKEQGLIS
jgi:hypothetical protein